MSDAPNMNGGMSGAVSYSHCPTCGQQVVQGQFLCGHTPIPEQHIKSLSTIERQSAAYLQGETERAKALEADRDTLKALLIATGRAMGCFLVDGVSNDLLSHLPEEARLLKAREEKAEAKSLLPGLEMALEIVRNEPEPSGPIPADDIAKTNAVAADIGLDPIEVSARASVKATKKSIERAIQEAINAQR